MVICQQFQQTLNCLPARPGQSAQNAKKSLAINRQNLDHLPRMRTIGQFCQEILDNLPRIVTILGRLPGNPGASAKNANKSSAIFRDCQELLLKYACQNTESALVGPACPIIRQPRQPINSETEFSKASQGPADKFIVRDISNFHGSLTWNSGKLV